MIWLSLYFHILISRLSSVEPQHTASLHPPTTPLTIPMLTSHPQGAIVTPSEVVRLVPRRLRTAARERVRRASRTARVDRLGGHYGLRDP